MSLSPIIPKIVIVTNDAPQPVAGAKKGFGKVLDASISRARDDALTAAATDRTQANARSGRDAVTKLKPSETAAREEAPASSDRSDRAASSDTADTRDIINAPDTGDISGHQDEAPAGTSSVEASNPSEQRELAASDDNETAAAPEGNTIADPQTQPDQVAPGQTVRIESGQPELTPQDEDSGAADEQQTATTRSLPAQADPQGDPSLMAALVDARFFAQSIVNDTFFPGQLDFDLKAALAPFLPFGRLQDHSVELRDLLASLDLSLPPQSGADAVQTSAAPAATKPADTGPVSVANLTPNQKIAVAKALAAFTGQALPNLLTGSGFGQALTQGTVAVPVDHAPAALSTTGVSELAVATQNTGALDISLQDLGQQREKSGLRFAGNRFAFAGNRFALAGQANIRAQLATQANEPGQPSTKATKAAISPGPFDEAGLPPPATPRIDAASIIDRLSGLAPNPTSPAAGAAVEASTEMLQALFDRFAPTSPGAIANPNGVQAQQSNALNMTALSAMAIRHSLLTASPAEQIVIHISRAFQAGTNKFSIRLHPAELGRVEVSMVVAHDGRVTAIVTAERQETLDLLQRDSRSLERALQDSGLKADAGSLNFSLRDGGEGEDSTADEGKSAAASLADDGFTTGTANPAEDEIVLALNRLGALHALDITI